MRWRKGVVVVEVDQKSVEVQPCADPLCSLTEGRLELGPPGNSELDFLYAGWRRD